MHGAGRRQCDSHHVWRVGVRRGRPDTCTSWRRRGDEERCQVQVAWMDTGNGERLGEALGSPVKSREAEGVGGPFWGSRAGRQYPRVGGYRSVVPCTVPGQGVWGCGGVRVRLRAQVSPRGGGGPRRAAAGTGAVQPPAPSSTVPPSCAPLTRMPATYPVAYSVIGRLAMTYCKCIDARCTTHVLVLAQCLWLQMFRLAPHTGAVCARAAARRWSLPSGLCAHPTAAPAGRIRRLRRRHRGSCSGVTCGGRHVAGSCRAAPLALRLSAAHKERADYGEECAKGDWCVLLCRDRADVRSAAASALWSRLCSSTYRPCRRARRSLPDLARRLVQQQVLVLTW